MAGVLAFRAIDGALDYFGVDKPDAWNELGDLLEFSADLMVMLQSVLPAPVKPGSGYKPAAPPSPQTRQRGAQDAYIRSRMNVGNQVHYDQITDPTRYTHEGGPSQTLKKYNQGTEFRFTRRGQDGPDIEYLRGPHPSTYPNSNWPAGVNKADFKPDTPSGRARSLPSGVYKILYDPDTGELKF
jgi:hypothetical protein